MTRVCVIIFFLNWLILKHETPESAIIKTAKMTVNFNRDLVK